MKYFKNIVTYSVLTSLFLTFSLFGAREYIGKAVPIIKESLNSTTGSMSRGWVDYSAQFGSIVKPAICNSKGKVIIPGDILIDGYTGDWEAYVKADEVQLAAQEKIKKLTFDIYERYKKLYIDEAVSELKELDEKSQYETALGKYNGDISILVEGKYGVDLETTKPPFEGIITRVSQGSGSDVGGAPCVTIAQLNPMGIKVDIPFEELLKYNHSTVFKVYLKGIDKPVGISHLYGMVSGNSVSLATPNYPVLEGNTILKESDVPVLRNWQPISRFDYNSTSSKVLGITLNSIQSDKKGSYVWRAKGQKVMQVDKGIDYTFPIEKVYVVLGDMIRYQSNYTKIISLKDNGGLELYDLVLNNPIPGLKNGETVVYPQQAFLIMPGDEVRVVMGSGSIENKKSVKKEGR